MAWHPLLFPGLPSFAFLVSGAASRLLPSSSRNGARLGIHSRQVCTPAMAAPPSDAPHCSRQQTGVLPAPSLGWNRNHFGSPLDLNPFLSLSLQSFFVLHKVALAASSAPASRVRHRTDASQPSKRSRDVDAADEDGSELHERLRTWRHSIGPGPRSRPPLMYAPRSSE
jgi:hypothetical protein